MSLPAAGSILYRVAKPRLPGLPRAPVSVLPPPQPPPPPSSPTYDYSTDPLLAQQRANALSDRQAAEHAIDARRRLSLLGFGSRALAMKSLGLGADDPFVQSIDENADTGTGTLAKLAHAYREAERGTDLNLNRQNLYYSSARTKALGDLAYQNSQQIADATRAMQSELEGLTEQGVAATGAYNRNLTGAEEGAMGRAQDFAFQYPQSGGIDTTLAALAAAVKKKKLATSTALTRYTK